jgi:hypothetical protein
MKEPSSINALMDRQIQIPLKNLVSIGRNLTLEQYFEIKQDFESDPKAKAKMIRDRETYLVYKDDVKDVDMLSSESEKPKKGKAKYSDFSDSPRPKNAKKAKNSSDDSDSPQPKKVKKTKNQSDSDSPKHANMNNKRIRKNESSDIFSMLSAKPAAKSTHPTLPRFESKVQTSLARFLPAKDK